MASIICQALKRGLDDWDHSDGDDSDSDGEGEAAEVAGGDGGMESTGFSELLRSLRCSRASVIAAATELLMDIVTPVGRCRLTPG